MQNDFQIALDRSLRQTQTRSTLQGYIESIMVIIRVLPGNARQEEKNTHNNSSVFYVAIRR